MIRRASCAAGALLHSAAALPEIPYQAFSTVPDSLRTSFAYCINQTRLYDQDNYKWCAQLPKEHRPAFFALRAFNIETATIVDTVKSKEQALIQIRFQWWRDTLSAIAKGRPPEHPVAVALHHAMLTAPLSRYNLKRMVDTREQDVIDPQPPLSTSGLEQYAEGTASQLLYLQLQAVGVQDKQADHAASHLGKAVGITTLLRGTAHHALRRRSYLPLDLCAQHGVSQEDIYRGHASAALKDTVLQVASVAKAHLDEAQAMCGKVPVVARAGFLPAVACAEYLTALEARDFNVFDPGLAVSGGLAPLKHTLKLKYNMLMKTF